MIPFEDLIRELSVAMNIDLHLDAHQSCRLEFLPEEIDIQVDLDTNADKILIGTELGRVSAGPYRERIFRQALHANGAVKSPQGVLAFSEKNDTLILFQFLELNILTGEKLYHFLQIFRQNANMWKNALSTGDIPHLPEETVSEGSMFGLR